MKKFQKFSDLTKGNKVFRIINLFLSLCMLVASIVALILNLYPDRHRTLVTVAMIVLTILPYIIELIMRKRFSNTILFAYLLYMIVAGIIGAVYDVYYQVFWYDRVVHTLMGYVATMLGLFVLSKLTDYKKLSVLAVIVFCFTFSLAVEFIWELFEWFSDLFLGQTAQGGAFPGDIPLVTDTMEDLLCNFSGTIIFLIHFIIGKISKVSLGIKSIELQLAGGECQSNFLKTKEKALDEGKKKEESVIDENVELDKNHQVALEEKPKQTKKKTSQKNSEKKE